MEFTIEAPDGMRHWYEASGQPIHTRGAEEGGVVVVRDITERSLRALQEEFLAVASHDLRTPLTATQVYLEMVIQLLSRNEASERTQRYADLALRQVHRLGELVQDLVDVARLQHGRLALSLTEVDLASVVREAVEVAQALAKGQSIQVTEADGSLHMRADRGRLHQVILNLLMNAITYAPATERIDVRLGATDSQAEVEIQDYGPGIPAAELPQIFSRFYRANAAAAADDTGLGLGLYIARELTAAHGGTLDARSTGGKGTTFTVRLPLSES
jgi:two-component system CheB/CheR fusion protein